MEASSKRGFARSCRVVIASLTGSLAIALAGCGEDNGGGAAAAAATTDTSASSSTSTTTTNTTSETTKGSGSATTPSPISPSPSPPPPPPPKTSTTASITLGWVPPTQNNDGSPITNLAGYKIHYGTTSTEYTKTIALANAGLTRYVLDNLTSGTYYFAITAYNSLGVESALSGEVATTVD
jgi:hypothetical protein